MQDIKVITRHTPSNYGSLLQSIATINTINKLGHKCSIIDYRRKDERGLNAILSAISKKDNWNNNLLKKIAYILVRFPIEFRAQFKFDRMRRKYLKLTNTCHTKSQLTELSADIFMTGSDQVWGPVLTQQYDDAYFLSFVENGTKKISYAASFGKTEFTPQIIADYKNMLLRYDKIAVRENSAVDLLHDWGIPYNGQVLDPTLLLTAKEWNEFVNKDIKGKYVLVYQLHNNPNLDDYAKSFAKEVGLPLVRISPSFHQITRGGKFVYLPNLGKFLSYIKNCNYFITDSFHGTAFAINFNKQFIEILPGNKTGTRNLSILQLTNLTDRIVRDYSDFSIKDRTIDYSSVNKIMDEEREKSIKLLSDMINN
nr:polysaccharide pyruvyl transferase family protein [uncultured Draconibacterium sp.]